MADLSKLSDQDLMQLYQVGKQETGNVSDSSTIRSSKGAEGSMQVTGPTQGQPGYGVKPSNGTPEDTAREGRDYFLALKDHYKDPMTAAIAYNWGPGNTDKWLENGADISQVPDETLKYAYNFNKSPAGQSTPAANVDSPQHPSQMTDEQLKAEYAKQKQPDAASQPNNTIMNNLKGAGLQAANLAAGAVEGLPIAGAAGIGVARRLLNGEPTDQALRESYEQAGQNFQQFSPENALNKMGVDTSNLHDTLGYSVPAEVMNFVGKTLPHELATAGTPGSMFSAAQVLSPEQQKVAEPAVGLGMLAAPFLHRGGMLGEGAEGAPADAVGKLAPDDAAAPSAEFVGPPRDIRMGPNAGPARPPIPVNAQGVAVDPLGDPNMTAYMQNAARQQSIAQVQMGPNAGPQLPAPVGPEMPPNAGPQIPQRQALARGLVQPGEPNMGPQRPAMTVDANGNVTNPLGNPDMAAFVEAARQKQATDNGDLFPTDTTGQASPFNPNRLSSDIQEPFNPRNPTNLRQGSFDFDQAVSPDELRASAAGEVGTAHQFAEVEPFREPLIRRMEALRRAEPEQLDIFSDTPASHLDQFAEEPEARSLSQDEFAQTVQELAAKDGTRFPMPDDLEEAYSKYLDTVRDDQGGLFDRASMGKNFVDAATKEALDRRVNDHPTVRANQARLDQLEAQDQSVPGVARATAAARDVLQTSQKNIGKFFEKTADAATPFYGKDGAVNMYTFGYLPELMKSLGAILKGIHGVVFKTLDRMIPNFKNLDSASKIMGQGIKNFVNKEATRDWSQTVNAKPIAQLSKVAGLRDAVTELNPHAQEELSPEELKNQFNTAPDLSSSKVGNALRNNILQGGLLLSDFSQHPLVKYVTDSVAKSFRNADKWSRENLLNQKNGLGPMIKRMSSQEFTEIRTLMEAYEGIKEFSENELRGRGYGDQQVAYYKRSLELQKETFTKWNEGRQAIGQPAMDPRMAHIAAYFMGDFKQIVKDSAGRVIAVLGHNNRAALGVIAKRFQEMHPDGDNLDMGKPELRRGSSDDNTFNGYMNILGHLSKNNADIQRLMDVYHDTQMASINKLSQMANRGKFKSNPSGTVGGAEGSKLWQSMEKNAQDGGKQQLKYLESVNRWSEFQKAMQKSQDFIQDPEVNAPNAKAVSQRYLDNQMHRNLGDLNKFTNSFVDGFSDITGVGPSQLRSLASLTKTGLLNVYVGLGKLSHSLVTSLQPLIGSPEVTSVLKARGAGFSPIDQFTSVLKGLNSVKDILQAAATGKQISDPFVRAASAYAKANDTFNTSQFNMGSVAHPSTKLGTALHINVTVPESGARAATYMRYVHLLKDTSDRAPIGQKLSDQEIFGTAHNAVQKVMADYNREAQAPVFAKLGFLGDLTRMLTTFKMNQISQAATAGKMLRQGQITPMVTMLASSLAASGLRGFIGYNIANGLLGQVTTWATKQGIMTQPTNLDQMILHMLHGKSQGLADALNFGAVSALGGIDMTGSLSHADDIPDDPLGTLIPQAGTIGKALGSAVQFAEHPNAQRGKAALYDALPNSMKGIMENMAYTNLPGKPAGNYYDPHTGNLVAHRSPTDQTKRALSFRPLDESKMRLEAEVGKGQNQQLDAVKSEISKRMLSDADSKSLTQQAMHQYAQQYFQAGGDPKELGQQLQTHLGLNKNLNIEQREAGIPKNFTGAERYQRAQGLK